MPRNPQKSWDDMTTEEKMEHTVQVLEEHIQFQNGANARMSAKIKALEERLARIDKIDPTQG